VVGNFPFGALGYDLDRSAGTFQAYHNGSYEFSMQSCYQLHYKSTISNKISKDCLSNLFDVSVKILFMWLNIVEVSGITMYLFVIFHL
jgi:Protein of unknown function, DUF538